MLCQLLGTACVLLTVIAWTSTVVRGTAPLCPYVSAVKYTESDSGRGLSRH
jgi:hypothetical protein